MTAGHWSDDGYAAIGRLVGERAGLHFPPNRQVQAETSMRQAMRRARLPDSASYAAYLERNEGALDDLLAQLTVGETYFFREPGQFAYLRDTWLPQWREQHGVEHVLRAWSAGCATGEEPYSLALTLRGAGIQAQVVGTDISRSRLALARRGLYRPWSLRSLEAQEVRRHFTRQGDQFQLQTAALQAVEFRYLNLARDVYPAISTGIWGMDLILCRNVLIYFDAETITRVAARLLDSLAEGGVLLLGASDPLLTEYASCDVLQTGAGVAYRRPRAMPLPSPAHGDGRLGEGRGPRPLPTPAPPEPPPALSEATSPAAGAGETLEARIGEAYAAHDYEAVVELARAGLVSGPNERASGALVRALANLGRLEEAGQHCAAALDRHRTSIELLYLHAVLMAQAGRLAEAAESARRVLYLDRGFVVGHLALAGALARLGDRAGASRAYDAAERLLARAAPDAVVPASDGEPAGRLLEMARLQKRLLARSVA